MAIFHVSTQIIRRSGKRSVVAAAAYRSADCLVDPRRQKRFDFTRKQGVIHREIQAPPDAPYWVYDRETLWGSVELAERRKDGQLARELEIALPHELDIFQQFDLVRRFVEEELVARGMVCDCCFHEPPRRGDRRNNHVHILLSLRNLSRDGWGHKNRSWNDRALLRRWRARWAVLANRALEEAGSENRIDHRSNLTRGIQRRPGRHLGPHVTALERQGIKTDLKSRLTVPIVGGAYGRVPPSQQGRCFQLFCDGRYREWLPANLAAKITRVDIAEDVRVYLGDEVASVADHRVSLRKGDEDGIDLLLFTAAALNWEAINLFGTDEFVLHAARAAVLAGWAVAASDPQQAPLVAAVEAALRPTRRRTASVQIAPPLRETASVPSESPRVSASADTFSDPCPVR